MSAVLQVVIGLAAVAGIIGTLLAGRARAPEPPPQPCCGTPPETPKPPKPVTLRERIERLLNAIDYLRTRREWRYRTPWVLLLGEQGAGKSSLAASISPRHRQAADRRQQELAVDGVEWHFLAKGALIDPAGRLPAAAADSADAQSWLRVLDGIDALRPERPLDGLLLAVSARTLQNKPAEQRRLLAENIHRQLITIQERFEFVLPVYVAVTGTDRIDGFAAFWRAQPAARQAGIFGWSAPAQAASGTPEEWADSAFDTVGERLKALQTEAAADKDHVDDVDRFFLFPRHFQQLRIPLKEWLAVVFQASTWQAGFLCRGIYFTGSVAADGADSGELRKDLSFVDGLVMDKVLAEPHLARPTRAGIWSRNKLIRRLQAAGIAACAVVAIGLAVATVQLNRQVDALIASLKLMQEISNAPSDGQACIAHDRVVDLLVLIAGVDTGSVYWAIPVSLLDSRMTRKSARMIAEDAFGRVIMPGLACRLKLRAEELKVDAAKAPDSGKAADDAYAQSRMALFDYLRATQALELNLERFRRFSADAPRSGRDSLMSDFTALAAYAYGTPLPAQVERERGALSAALAEVRYRGTVELPTDLRQRVADQILRLSERLKKEFDGEVKAGNSLLDQLIALREPVLGNTRHFTRWLTWTRKSWLGSTASSNPCEDIRKDLGKDINHLVSQYGYSTRLEAAATRFDAEQCYKPSMAVLTGMQLAPYGSLFVKPGKALELNPALEPELAGLSALVSLDYMQVANTRKFECRAGTSAWRAADIGQATNYAREYQNFAHSQGLPPLGTSADKRPLYDDLARHQLELVMNTSMSDAQQPPLPASSAQSGLDAAARADQQLAQQSNAFGAAMEPLLGVLRLYGQNNFAAGDITQCVRNFASGGLGQTDALARTSRLYDPEPGPSGGQFFNLGTTPVIKDYLARQVARSQVLAGYATPFVTFLQNTEGVNEANKTNAETAPYWNNTIAELNRYVQFKESNGAVGQLDSLFLKQFADLSAANCGKVLDYKPADPGNDLFSARRKQLEDQVRAQCSGDRDKLADLAYQQWATRFTRDLAGRYPFAELRETNDADPAKVKAFFTDYDAQRAGLQQTLAGLTGARWTAVRRFLDQLDAVSAFFRGTLTGGDVSQPVRISVLFRPQPGSAIGSDQVLNWRLTSGAKSTGSPNRPSALDWPYGQPLAFDLAWANLSLWRPVRDPQQGDMQVEGASASFAASGEWALLRMIEAHRPKFGPVSDPLDANRVLLEFTVPVVSTENPPGKTPDKTARLYMSFNMTGKDPKTQAPATLTLPAVFPRSAP